MAENPEMISLPGGFFPHAGFTDGLWINFQAKKIKDMATGGRGGNLVIDRIETTFQFLAPTEIMEMHNHDWQEYTSVASRFLEMAIKGWNMWDQYKGTKGSFVKGFKESGGAGSLKSFAGIAAQAASVGSTLMQANVPVPMRKVDTPLAYKNSQRRQYQLAFILAEGEAPGTMTAAVQLMEQFAAAKLGKDNINFEFPHVFKVWSEPKGLIDMSLAAITSIQPTWHHPYKDGYPTRCDLTISITDVSPLFAETLQEGTIITVVEPESSFQSLSGRV